MKAPGTLTGRLVTLAMLVALASVAVTGVAMIGLFRQGATRAAQASLARDADTVAATTADIQALRAGRARRIQRAALDQLLRSRQISLITVEESETASATTPFTSADVEAVRRDGTLSTERDTGSGTWLIEGRSRDGASVLLAQPLDQAVAESSLGRERLLIPLVLGLLGGALAGLLLARQIAAPLGGLAAAARRLSGGDREVRVPPEGPREVVEVAHALNDLAAALAGSEERQRRFLMNVSHELRTPLTAVTGYAEGLADEVITGAEVPAAAAVIRTEAARLDRRVEDLLALARLEADDFRLLLAPADLTGLVTAAAMAWRPRAEATGIGLWVESPEHPLIVDTDAERVRQVIDALADNALRVLSPGDSITFSCGLIGTDDEDGRVAGIAGIAWVEVRDDGPGLAEADLAVAFDRGRLTERYRGDRPVGSGLGLALVGELARRLGGRAVARPGPEGGVSFAVRLPH